MVALNPQSLQAGLVCMAKSSLGKGSVPDLASRGRQLLQKSCFALNLVACGQFAQTARARMPGQPGGDPAFQNPTFLLLPVLCSHLTWFCLLGCGRKTPLSNLLTAVTRQQCWFKATWCGRQGVENWGCRPQGWQWSPSCSPVHCRVKERWLHFLA